MDKTIGIIAVIVIVLAIGVVFALFYKSPTSPSTVSTVQTSAASTTIAATTNSTNKTSGQGNITVQQYNNTLSSPQVINILGTGWTAAQEYAVLNRTTTVRINGNDFRETSYAAANFTGNNGGSYLSTEWIELSGIGAPASYVNATMANFAANPNVTTGTYSNASYIYASGPAISGGQEASFMYAYDGQYVVSLVYKGNSFTLQQAEQLLNQQLINLNLTTG